MRTAALVCASALAVLCAGLDAEFQSSARNGSAFSLTVDSIMRGPALVGYPPSDLRWSGDSKELYFEWRMPGEDEPATWVVPRDGGEPRRLTDEQRRSAPPENGVWDRQGRRALAVQDGDVVLIDTVARTRRMLTRTVAAESSPRWARGETHVTFVRDNNVFIVPLASGDGGLFVQLTDVSAKKPDPAVTDSQKFLEQEEQKLLEAVKEAAERKNRDMNSNRARIV